MPESNLPTHLARPVLLELSLKLGDLGLLGLDLGVGSHVGGHAHARGRDQREELGHLSVVL